jgi:hypothetical protein
MMAFSLSVSELGFSIFFQVFFIFEMQLNHMAIKKSWLDKLNEHKEPKIKRIDIDFADMLRQNS